MNSISNFFNKFLKLQHDSEELKIKITETIKKFSGLQTVNFEFKEGNLSFNCSPLERTQILLNKSKIINELLAQGIKVNNLR